MASYVLIPGADGRAWYWYRLAPLLEARGHSVVSVDLPVADGSAGYEEYVEAAMQPIAERRTDLILVAQSLGGFIAPIIATQLPVAQIILLNAMVPRPGESANDWWENTGQQKARVEYYARQGLELPAKFDVFEAFFHDAPPGVLDKARSEGEQAANFDTLFSQPWPLKGWPDVPTRFLQGRDDRFFPLEFQRRTVRERLGIAVEELPGGHLLALSQPAALAERLEASTVMADRID